jgi:serine/threonine protein kinase
LGAQKKPAALTPKLSAEILKGVAEGMNYLHTLLPHPIIHRDLTSLNILVPDLLDHPLL